MEVVVRVTGAGSARARGRNQALLDVVVDRPRSHAGLVAQLLDIEIWGHSRTMTVQRITVKLSTVVTGSGTRCETTDVQPVFTFCSRGSTDERDPPTAAGRRGCPAATGSISSVPLQPRGVRSCAWPVEGDSSRGHR